MIKSFLKRQFPTLISFLYSYLFYLGYDMTGTGIELTTSSEFIENSKEWFYIGCLSFVIIEILYQVVKRDKILKEHFFIENLQNKDISTAFSICKLISIFSAIYFGMFIFNMINDFYFIALSPIVIFVLYYCYRNNKSTNKLQQESKD
ncbi:MAG: hypothetical protein PHV08_04100 [Sulfurovaceae bacterium]|nr:hypothetical protein [Sulfurovaceae bacterium]